MLRSIESNFPEEHLNETSCRTRVCFVMEWFWTVMDNFPPAKLAQDPVVIVESGDITITEKFEMEKFPKQL